MASFLTKIKKEDKRILNIKDESDLYTIAYDSDFTFTKIDSRNDATFYTKGTNSVWSLLNMYSLKIFDSLNVDYSEGGLKNTFLEGILEAYNSYGLIMFEASESNWRKMVNGQNVEIKFPLDATYTGGTSGLTATTLYSSFIDSDSVKKQSTNSLCDGFVIDSLYSEPSVSWTDSYGLGYKFNASNKYHKSGIVFLMSNDSAGFSGATGTSKDWSAGYGIKNKYTYDRAPLITPTGPDRDTASGIFFTNSGIGFVWEENFVKGFDFTGSTGGTGTTAVHFVGDQAYINGGDVDTRTSLQVDLILTPEMFNTTLNDSYREDALMNGAKSCDTAFDSITLTDNAGNCLAVAIASEPITKIDTDFRVIKLDIPIDGNIQTQSGVCVYGGC